MDARQRAYSDMVNILTPRCTVDLEKLKVAQIAMKPLTFYVTLSPIPVLVSHAAVPNTRLNVM
jgi:hypothetical protein